VRALFQLSSISVLCWKYPLNADSTIAVKVLGTSSYVILAACNLVASCSPSFYSCFLLLMKQTLKDLLLEGGIIAKDLPSDADLAAAFKAVDKDKNGK